MRYWGSIYYKDYGIRSWLKLPPCCCLFTCNYWRWHFSDWYILGRNTYFFYGFYFASFIYWLQSWRFLSKSWVHAVNSPMLFSSYNCRMLPLLVLGEKSSSVFLILSHCLDNTDQQIEKWFSNIAATKKCAYIWCWKCSWIKVHCETGNTKVHRSTFIQIGSLFLKHQVGMKAKWMILHRQCWDKKNPIAVHIRPITSPTYGQIWWFFSPLGMCTILYTENILEYCARDLSFVGEGGTVCIFGILR